MAHMIAAAGVVVAADDVAAAGVAAAVVVQMDYSSGTVVASDGRNQTYPSSRLYVVHQKMVPKIEVFPNPCPCPSPEYEGRQPDCGTAY